ncbi:MAG: hypothetical protein EPO28_04065 [Saprospiraceae bacterium]|nr:MAG: hypothetical protein EPO28_04065 [Saprospiraceae bacterium]
MDKPKNVTYLLGAGASANALPVVSIWGTRLEQFSSYLDSLNSSYCDEKGIDIEKVKAEIKELLNDANNHATIDHYARKLFIKSSKEEPVQSLKEGSGRRLLSLKHFLGCFFSFEQNRIESFWENFGYIDEDGKEHAYQLSDSFEGQKVQVDPRYDVFFAKLLDSNSMGLDERVSIISWNYDLQLELAYKDFNEKDNPQVMLGVHPNAYDINEEKLREQGRRFQVIKLNGSAGLVHTPTRYPPIMRGLTGHFFPVSDRSDNVTFQEFVELRVPTIEALLTIYSNFLNRNPQIEPSLRFAWEDKGELDKSVKYLQEILPNTATLVVIGYSFPDFNKSIDKEILKMLPSGCKIYYQDSKERVDGLIQRLKGLFLTQGKEFPPIEPYTDLDQFFIPYEL